MQEWQSVPSTEIQIYAPGFVYPRSVHRAAGCLLGITKVDAEKRLLVVQEQTSPLFSAIWEAVAGSSEGRPTLTAPLSRENAAVLRNYLPFMAPVPFGREGLSLGLGDRLGLAAPGHLRTVRGTGVKPVLAQQSIRELNLTARTYEDVLAAASWGVLEEGFHDGFSADGDHLKKSDEVKMALDLGFSMITLDCSEHIVGGVDDWSDTQVITAYEALPATYRQQLEELYLNREFQIGNARISYPESVFKRIVIVYGKALQYCEEIFSGLIRPYGRLVDFEVSIDETATPTTPAAHYFVAAELERLQVGVTSVAPRFCGEFQKAIDYIGNIRQFEQEFELHARIADTFGYRLSIHSGSDKLSVYPIISRYTQGRVHVKTAGTNWLEGLKVISLVAPNLFRELYRFAVTFFPEARKYYHVTTKPENFRDVSKLADADLPALLNEADSRQLLHITYGGMLLFKEGDNHPFRDGIYQVLQQHEEEYAQALLTHIGAHLRALGK